MMIGWFLELSRSNTSMPQVYVIQNIFYDKIQDKRSGFGFVFPINLCLQPVGCQFSIFMQRMENTFAFLLDC